MNWFERHLNWSLFFGTFLLPICVSLIFTAIWLAILWGQLAPFMFSGMEGFSGEALVSIMLKNLPLIIIGSLISLAVWIFGLIVMWWYLGQKARSKWFMLLYLPAVVLGSIYNATNSSSILFGLFFLIVGLVCMIIFYRLGNKRIGYGGDFVSEPATDYWRPDTGQFASYENQQPKELDYSPAKNVQDIAHGGAEKGAMDVGVPSREVPPPFPPKAPEEIPPEVSAQISPEVPVEAGAETRADIPPEVPSEVHSEPTVEFSVEVVDEVPPQTPAEERAEAKVAEQAARPESLKMPILLDDAGVVIKCSYHPDADAVNMCSKCGQYVCSQCNYVTGTHPICRNCWYGRAEAPISPVSPEAQESPKLSETEKSKAEEDERLREFMLLYEQAAPIIRNVIKKGADGSPSSPLELMDGLKLRPMLEHAQKLPKPENRELQEVRKEFEQLLLSCIKVAETAAEFVSLGEQAMPGEAYLARLTADIETANRLMSGLSQRVASLSQSPGD